MVRTPLERLATGQCSAQVDRMPGKCALIRFPTGSTLTAPVERCHVLYACVGIRCYLQDPSRHLGCNHHDGMVLLSLCKLMLAHAKE